MIQWLEQPAISLTDTQNGFSMVGLFLAPSYITLMPILDRHRLSPQQYMASGTVSFGDAKGQSVKRILDERTMGAFAEHAMSALP